LREGTIAAADREKGLRILEPVDRAANAQGAILAGANLGARACPASSP